MDVLFTTSMLVLIINCPEDFAETETERGWQGQCCQCLANRSHSGASLLVTGSKATQAAKVIKRQVGLS